MLRVFTHTVICSSSNASIDSSSIASHARIFGPIILGRLGATLRRSSKNVYPYHGAFPGLTMMRAGSVLIESKWTPVAASLRRNQPTAAGKFCLCKLNLAPGAVNGKLSAPLCVGHNRATLSAKDITDPLSHIFFATWCPSQKIRKFPARMVNLARARNFLCPSQVMPFFISSSSDLPFYTQLLECCSDHFYLCMSKCGMFLRNHDNSSGSRKRNVSVVHF